MSATIYHLARRAPWDAAVADGTPYTRSTVDSSLEEVGYIHCSFSEQVQGVADRFYRGLTDIVLLSIDPLRLEAEVRTENGYPHIYGPLPLTAVVSVVPVTCGADGRLLVDERLTSAGPDRP
jgi:uncharacterized protein (DUF952 family)